MGNGILPWRPLPQFDENTMQAFNGAYKAGYRGFETDIRMTKDGDLVLMHDSSLERTTNAKGTVEGSKTKTVKNAKTLKGNRVVLFDDFVKWIGSKGDLEYVEFELKTDSALYSEDLVCKMCDEVYNKIMNDKPAGATFVISSFDPRPLIYIKFKHSDAELMYITSDPVNDVALGISLGADNVCTDIPVEAKKSLNKAMPWVSFEF